MAHDIFISYSHKDKTTADAICNYLEGEGLRCWYAPRDITPGTEWGVAILEGIKAAKIMVLVFTPDANLSQQVLREVNNAVDAGLAIIPFRLTEEEPVAGMKYYLSTVHWMDAMNDELEASLPRLHDLCKAILEKKPVQATARPTGTAAAQPKSKLPVIAAVAGVAIVGAIAATVLLGGNKGGSGDDGSLSMSSVMENYTETTVSENAQGGGAASIVHDSTDYDIEYALGATTEGLSSDLSETYTSGNNQANLQNRGYFATDGEWYYFASNDGGKMYRMRADGTEKTKLTDVACAAISVYDGYVYFYDTDNYQLTRMKPDGSELTVLYEDGEMDARIINDRIYFGDFGTCSIALDGSDFQQHNELKGFYFTYDGTHVFYTDKESWYLMRANLDGSGAVCLLDHRIINLKIAGDKLFFYDNDTKYTSAYDLSTGEVTMLTAEAMNDSVIMPNGIYGADGRGAFYFLPLDSIGVKHVLDEWVNDTCVAGDKIFFRNSDDDAYYIMDLDGSNVTKV